MKITRVCAGLWLYVVPLFAGLAGCGGDPGAQIPPPGPRTQPWLATESAGGPWNLLLITLDTTRRDRLGCYGQTQPLTPNLDRLANRGVLFEEAVSPVPVTLPAHATILTGLDPQEHGVRNNGTFVLDSTRATLATVLQARGYATGATLGAFPLDARFGLSRGFDTYDDDFPMGSKLREWQTAQRPAGDVTRLALAWIEAHRDRPFFHWVHYFDPHFPYEPPEPYARRFAQPYDGEIAYMDAAVGELVQGLEPLGLAQNTWILCVADHGESLGEHGEQGHSMLLYGATQHVPCILVAPEGWRGLEAGRIRGRRLPDLIGLRDLAPTLVNALGLERDALPASGASLLPRIAGQAQAEGVVYTETLVPFLEYGWSELRGVRTRRWSYIRAPQPELYDLKVDPGEQANVLARHPRQAAQLGAWCDRFSAAGSPEIVTQSLDPETIERLRSLGYVATAAPRGPSRNDKDPRTLMPLFDEVNAARTALAEQKLEEARRRLEDVLRSDPGNPQATRLLGTTLLRFGDWSGARAIFESVLNAFPDDVDARLQLALACHRAGDESAAERQLVDLYRQSPQNESVGDLYAEVLVRQGRIDEARRILQPGPDRGAEQVSGLVRLALFEWTLGDRERGVRAAREALAQDSTQATALGILGESRWQQSSDAAAAGQEARAAALRAEARALLGRALQHDATEPMAAFRMGWLARQAGETQPAYEFYQRALSRRPDMAVVHANLGNLLREMNRPAEALQHYQIAFSLGLEDVNLLVNQGVALAMLGRVPEAKIAWERALALAPDARTREGIQRNLDRLSSGPGGAAEP